MNKYSTGFIKQYILNNITEISKVNCGMKEDWHWTCDTVWDIHNGFDDDYDWDSDYIEVAGITGSIWATPVMEVYFNDGRTEIVPCFVDDGIVERLSKIEQCKMFAKITGGYENDR